MKKKRSTETPPKTTSVSMVSGQGDQQSVSPGNDDMSDFASGSDLPLSVGDGSPVKVAADRVNPQRNDGIRSRTDSVRSLRSSGCVFCVSVALFVSSIDRSPVGIQINPIHSGTNDVYLIR